MADRTGKVLRASRHIARLKEILGGRLREKNVDARMAGEWERVATADDVLEMLARWGREKKMAGPGGGDGGTRAGGSGRSDPGAIADGMHGLAEWAARQTDPAMVQGRGQIVRALAGTSAELLDPALAESLFPREAALRLSVSKLEKFAACPLQYFAQYTLGLSPRKEFQIDQLDMGRLVHRAAERMYGAIIAGKTPWPELPPEELPRIVGEALDAAVRELHAELEMRTPGYRQIRRRVQRVLEVHAEADRRRALAGRMRPAAAELDFSGGAQGQGAAGGRLVRLPVLSWRTAGGRVLELSGKIDRVDAAENDPQCMAVVDYKSARSRQIKFAEVAGGFRCSC